ncbi:hypothetical protein [Flexivirga caeni]|uniref:hypothetical protein n=1 Tax=Flexivirga caeni TaxID=2294115 RepID=UPI0011CE532B|nr:hypothetical protein [Flexivirga caeni]
MEVLRSGWGIEFAVPNDWAPTATPQDGGIVALEPRLEEFRANIVLVSGPAGTRSLRQWQAAVEAELPSALAGYQLIDLTPWETDVGSGGRRLAQYTTVQGDYLSMEQWFVRAGSVGHTLTATVETFRYSVLAPTFRAMAESLTLPGVSR